ncbi:MAG TPA: bacteriohemerythrin [bacterium]|nr:bacteriohemerythrin [bacterium]
MSLPLRWQFAYSVGVHTFDEAHRVLIERADALIAAVKGPNPASRARDIADDLVECAVEHFEEEERVLRELDWPGLPEHEQAHSLLLRTLLKFKADLRYGRLSAEEAAAFITDWVLAHIQDEDMQYTAYLHARGMH